VVGNSQTRRFVIIVEQQLIESENCTEIMIFTSVGFLFMQPDIVVAAGIGDGGFLLRWDQIDVAGNVPRMIISRQIEIAGKNDVLLCTCPFVSFSNASSSLEASTRRLSTESP